MPEGLITLNLDENIFRIVKARNVQGHIELDLIGSQYDFPPFFESDTQKILDEVTEKIKKNVEMYKLTGKKLNIVIPDGFTYSQIIFMPKLKEKELLSAIRYQADQFIPMPIEDTSLDLDILYEDKAANKLLVLIIAAPQKLIEKVQELAEKSGFYPENIENELSSTARFLSTYYYPAPSESNSIFINLGYSSTSFYFFDHKLRLLTDSHNFRAGFSVFLREAKADINIDSEKAKNYLKKIGFSQNQTIDFNQILQPSIDALVNELRKFINSLQTKIDSPKISRLYIYNLTGNILNFDKKIEAEMAIPTLTFNPQNLLSKTNMITPQIKDLSPYIAAIGGCIE